MEGGCKKTYDNDKTADCEPWISVKFIDNYYYCSDKCHVIRTLTVFLTILGFLSIYAIVSGLATLPRQ
ncbi:hypothetical protein PC129_g15784 [Phytophthora cactorum]|uniref:Uncharacterized protein n=1 Tax=Phytophthora cactorum TaxID=29920 RepID=A0A8T1GK55_9STRA|nr:hypothetical protein PC111_g6853 [Phytophthora cactorum]KAG2844939.1 hypothetical protein PC112_g2055 [Phytophthora cactorum]KAG2993067.1 hypothetical protein PC118_g4222 [Phytophthora cactorum]KAG3037798.1 hypothetical protein PC119_g3394 [Phytophthora cactorum]KAG3071338.1 hypothetical protein PC121_g9261 [Phytophthora cactorum]